MSWDGVEVKVVVRSDPFTGTGEVLHEDTMLVHDHAVERASLDTLYGIANGFPHERLGVTDWVDVAVTGRSMSAGGDGQSAQIVVEMLGGLKDVAWNGLAVMFGAYLVDKLKSDDSE